MVWDPTSDPQKLTYSVCVADTRLGAGMSQFSTLLLGPGVGSPQNQAAQLDYPLAPSTALTGNDYVDAVSANVGRMPVILHAGQYLFGQVTFLDHNGSVTDAWITLSPLVYF